VRFIFHSWSDHLSLQTNSSEDEPVPPAGRGPVQHHLNTKRRCMKIVSFYKPLPISDPNSFIDVTTEQPRPGARDLLVEVQAISVNPVDAKIRSGGGPGSRMDNCK
jgi:hypothetical protein